MDGADVPLDERTASDDGARERGRGGPRIGPTTVLQLVLIAFGVVTLPLAAVVVTAVVQVDRLDERSWKAVVNAEQTTKAAQDLVDLATAMERSARQYLVLGDEALQRRYEDSREQSRRAAELLAWLDTQGTLAVAIDEFLEESDALHGELVTLMQGQAPAETPAALETAFNDLSGAAHSIVELSSERIWSEASVMSSDAGELKQLLLWQAAAVIPLTFVLAVVFTLLINRPLGQIDRAIRRIGDGQLDHGIEIRGPRDLEELGERLDWLRNRLALLEAQKTAFLRHVSHELKTPLTAIREGAELLGDRRGDAHREEHAEIVRIIRESSVQLQQLIENLLKVSAAGNPVSPPKRRIVTVHKLLQRVLSDHKLAIASKSLTVEQQQSKTKLRGDRERLRVIFDNVLSNAVKFTPEGGTIRIETTTRDGWVHVDFIDDGPGIHPDERTQVLEPFYQGKAVFTGHVKGTGLGLAIASEYARSHGGALELLDSNAGAHVRVRIPLAHSPDMAAGAAR